MRPSTRVVPSRPPVGLPVELENDWTYTELLPFLVAAYGEPHKGYWGESVRRAASSVHNLPIHEDFESTIERIRLLLINPQILTDAETKDIGELRDDKSLCVAVFVRHFLNHGPYKLHSLGHEPDPDHPRHKTSVEDPQKHIYGGKMSRKRGNNASRQSVQKPGWRRNNEHKSHKMPVNKFDKNGTAHVAPRIEEPQVPTASRLKSKATSHHTAVDRNRSKPGTPRTGPNTNRSLANPALNDPGIPIRDPLPMSGQGVPQTTNDPMHMQGASRLSQQWNTSHAVIQPYSAPPHSYNSYIPSTLSQDNRLHETSYKHEHARPVGSPLEGIAYSQHHQGHPTPSIAALPAVESSRPGFRVADLAVQPSDSGYQLRMIASDFVPGVGEHNF
ncbi:hypothetical protein DE146DRAFT_398114 [Phaeosphaeria sp. MPI-PUGE-AT-0046c]|nr:hypothetical protein DE146DRAFT_398114 [Phaeosphaeria sp. MPI-PUGE-AT-0046c]